MAKSQKNQPADEQVAQTATQAVIEGSEPVENREPIVKAEDHIYNIGHVQDWFVKVLPASANFYFDYQNRLEQGGDNSVSRAAEWAIYKRIRELETLQPIPTQKLIALDGEDYLQLVVLATEGTRSVTLDVDIHDDKPFRKSRDFTILDYHFTLNFNMSLAATMLNTQKSDGVWEGYKLALKEAFLVNGEKITEEMMSLSYESGGFGYAIAAFMVDRINGFFQLIPAMKTSIPKTATPNVK